MKPKTEAPVHLSWDITLRCNAHCVHCSSNSGPDAQPAIEFSTAEACQIIDQLAEAGVRVLSFSGGEPLLRTDLTELVRYATTKGLTTNVCTNGSLITEKSAAELKEAGLGNITISLDGACAETHDRFRQSPGLFALAVSAIRTLIKHDHRVGINFTPTKENYLQTAEVASLAHTLGADSVCVSQYIPTGRGRRDLMLTHEQLRDLALEAMELRKLFARRTRVHWHDCHVALLLPPDEQKNYLGCGAGIATARLCADGTLTPCAFMSTPAGNIRTSSFAEIWDSSELLHTLRDREMLKEGNCGACAFKLVCGGCRAAAAAIHGDPLQGDPSCWMFPERANRPERELVA